MDQQAMSPETLAAQGLEELVLGNALGQPAPAPELERSGLSELPSVQAQGALSE